MSGMEAAIQAMAAAIEACPDDSPSTVLAEAALDAMQLKAERDCYWQALVDIAGWENWQARSGPTWREIATHALALGGVQGGRS